MFICNNCHEFITPKIHEDWKHGTTSALCPECGSDDIEEAVQCNCCGEHFESYEINWLGLCKKCTDTLKGEIFFDICRYSRDYNVEEDDLIQFIIDRLCD